MFPWGHGSLFAKYDNILDPERMTKTEYWQKTIDILEVLKPRNFSLCATSSEKIVLTGGHTNIKSVNAAVMLITGRDKNYSWVELPMLN